MIKKLRAATDNFLYRRVIRNALKLSSLGKGFVLTGAESGVNFEYIYNDKSSGDFIIGKFIDRALLNLPSVQATKNRKDVIQQLLWNEIINNHQGSRPTRILDIASGGARYVRDCLRQIDKKINVSCVCIDKDSQSIELGKNLVNTERLSAIRFIKADVFNAKRIRFFAQQKKWQPNIVIASGFFIYFPNEIVESMLEEINALLPDNGIIIFSSYEQIKSKKLMRKAMATSDGKEWVLYYRKPSYWHETLIRKGYRDIYVFRDSWEMGNVCIARKTEC